MRRVNNNYTIHDKLYSLSLYEIIANCFLLALAVESTVCELCQSLVLFDMRFGQEV